ncbi:glycylpeptide N-tetradecanoyltransferase [Coemansia thaxteri]|uniref:Glycylpeptide N-tetradecanoyltransferase n=1 Tax=Coemansia thaxteri TaxID=2663907 RepID=A0A9W8EJT4_9FUNG|nr:glycylpeptide N-tetradecanoyltransferase [Coemansia thaxteri]KAJ2486722.1 glycylpeptide N-tetradecanoyltransferase [Coemansia sp. RSA 2320]
MADDGANKANPGKQQAVEGSSNVPAASFDTDKLRQLIQQLEAQSLSRDPGASKLQREEAAEKVAVHEFWSTQPVPKSSEEVKDDGPLHPPLAPEQIPKDPYALPEGMEWCLIDIEVESEMKEFHDLLLNNYVEDADSMFRFNYSLEFLRWALLPPGFNKDWHVGVRSSSTKELIAFISGIPVDMMVRDKKIRMAEINFLCLHKDMRSQRMAPLLIKEVTRRVHLVGIFQAVYTVGRLLPKPVSTCRYFHRSLNPKKLMDTGFSQKLEGAQLAKTVSSLWLPTLSTTPGLRPMRKGDVGQVRKLLNRHLKTRYDVLPVFVTDAEIAHWFLPREGVVSTYVVDDAEAPGKLSDFISFYSLPSSVLKPVGGARGKGVVRKPQGVKPQPAYTSINAAYLFYYGTKTDYGVTLTEDEKQACGSQKKAKESVKNRENALIKSRLTELARDALISAKQAGFDVFNCLDMMDNSMFTRELKFGPGDGYLRYYFYNYRARTVSADKIGFVML